tara:strand:- start:47 stop:763 length:717 start_codon:yes stop_codon:yes gene_type:complete
MSNLTEDKKMARQKAQYNTRQVLELAIEVDKAQGFIKSGYGYFDQKADKQVYDNKTAILNMLEGATELMSISKSSVEQADKIVDEFKQELIAKKLSGNINDFESNVLQSIGNETVEKFGVAVLASLPNSFRVLQKRQGLDDFFDEHRKSSEFVGKIGERLRFPAFIKDVKFIAKYNIHLVTCLTKENNIIKFFFNREPDIQGLIEGKDVILTGKVKTHDISKFSNCKETVFNYVRIEQ